MFPHLVSNYSLVSDLLYSNCQILINANEGGIYVFVNNVLVNKTDASLKAQGFLSNERREGRSLYMGGGSLR